MTKKLEITRWDTSETLESEQDIAGYLAEAFETNELAVIRKAMANVAKARNMTQIAAQMGISRRGLYKMFSDTGNPELATVQKFLDVIGVKMSIRPAVAAYLHRIGNRV